MTHQCLTLFDLIGYKALQVMKPTFNHFNSFHQSFTFKKKTSLGGEFRCWWEVFKSEFNFLSFTVYTS